MKRSLVALAALMVFAAIPAMAAPVTQIEVTGTGKVAIVPDEATIDASITTVDPNAQAATSRNNATYDAVTNALAAQGVARADMALSYYNVSYQPKPPPQPGVAPAPAANYGYTVTRSFAVRVRDIGKAGTLVDTLASHDGIDVNGVAFGLADSHAARAQATDKAVADARAKAELIAAASGLHIVSIARVTLEGGGIPVPMMRMSAESANGRVPTTLDPGNVNVTVNVGMIFSASP